MAIYHIGNGPMQTTAQFAGVTTGTAIKTMLQVKPSATLLAKIIEWGFSWDGHASNTGLQVELIETDVAATVTAAVLADITKYDAAALAGGDQTTNLIQVGTTSTGYTATAEGSITAVRNLGPSSYEYGVQAGKFVQQFPLGREPVIQIGKFGRIRALAAGNAVTMKCYMVIEI
jgi:hypothetical protein